MRLKMDGVGKGALVKKQKKDAPEDVFGFKEEVENSDERKI